MYIIIFNFTFQSGYIQIEVRGFDVIDVDTFTFQSGYIQIQPVTFFTKCV